MTLEQACALPIGTRVRIKRAGENSTSMIGKILVKRTPDSLQFYVGRSKQTFSATMSEDGWMSTPQGWVRENTLFGDWEYVVLGRTGRNKL